MRKHFITDINSGYNGISCSNDENYMSVSLQLLEMLLLTMSNLFFLPAIIIGLYRRYWQETVVYIIAMATSTMYHACDQFSTQKYYCIAEYDTLQYADFLAATAAVSYHVTLALSVRAVDHCSLSCSNSPSLRINIEHRNRTSL